MAYRFAGALIVFLAGSQTAAAQGVSIPEPGDPWLFGLGVVGLLVGRRIARRRPPPD
jgi:MYXO-CTERM domain-containing protein